MVAVGLALAAPIVLISSGQYAHQVGYLPDATIRELTVLPTRLFASNLLAGALCILAVFAWTDKWRAAAFATAWAVLPIAAIWVASNLGNSYWMSRYMLFTLPGFALLAAAGIARLNTRIAVAVMLVLALLGAQDQRAMRFVGSHDQWYYPEIANEYINYTAAADIIAQNYRPGDAIAYANRSDYFLRDIGVAYHMRGKEMPRDIFVTQTALQRGDFWPQECERAADCVKDVQRVWVVSIGLRTRDALDEMESDKQSVLREQYRVQAEWYPSGLDIWLMERKGSTA